MFTHVYTAVCDVSEELRPLFVDTLEYFVDWNPFSPKVFFKLYVFVLQQKGEIVLSLLCVQLHRINSFTPGVLFIGNRQTE